jgi:hypothetical protein
MMRAALLISALWCFGVVSISAQQQVIHIQFLNGKNGRPLRHTQVIINFSTGLPHRNYVKTSILLTNNNGVVDIQAAASELITANPYRSFGRSCQNNLRYGPSYDVSRIFESGITEDNHCGPKLPLAQPGQLTVAFRHESFREGLGDD